MPFLAFLASGPSDRLGLCPPSLFAFGNVPAPFTHLAEDTTLGYPLAKASEQTLLRFSWFQLNSHSAFTLLTCILLPAIKLWNPAFLQRQKKSRLLASSHAMRVEPSFPNVSRLDGKIWCPVQDNELIVNFSPLPPPGEMCEVCRQPALPIMLPFKGPRSGGHRPFTRLWVSQNTGRSFSDAPPLTIIPYLTVLVNKL